MTKNYNTLILNEYLKLFCFMILFEVALDNQNINVYLINWIELLIIIRIQPTNYYRTNNTLPLSLTEPFILMFLNPYLYSPRLWKLMHTEYQAIKLTTDCEHLYDKIIALNAECENVEKQLDTVTTFLNNHPEQQSIITRCQYYWWTKYYGLSNQRFNQLRTTYINKHNKLDNVLNNHYHEL